MRKDKRISEDWENPPGPSEPLNEALVYETINVRLHFIKYAEKTIVEAAILVSIKMSSSIWCPFCKPLPLRMH